MSFLNPWVALGLAAVAIPALVILYFLKLRRREERVPSTFLWRRAVQDLQVNAPFQRLRKNLLLLLQLLILGAALFALARPIVKTDVADETSIVLMIDRSASMKAVEGNRTRFDLAKEQAVRYLQTLNRTSESWWSFLGFGGADVKSRVMVVAFSDRPQVICPFTTNASEAISLVEDLTPTDGQTNLTEAVKLAQAYMMPGRGNVETGTGEAGGGASTGASGGAPIIQNPVSPETSSRLVLFSDGCIANVEEVPLMGGPVTLIPAGESKDNVGITALRIARNYEKPEILDVFAQVQNFGPETVTTDVTLFVDGEFSQGRVETITLGPPADPSAAGGGAGEEPLSSRASLSFQFPLDRAAVIEARLSRGDALATDNRAYAVVPPPKKLSVLLVTENNPFLEFVLKNLPLERWKYLTPAQYEAAAAEQQIDGRSVYDAIIFDKYVPKELPTGNFIFFQAVPPLEAVKSEGEIEDYRLMWWDETHPLLRHVQLDYVDIAKGIKLSLPRQAMVLADGQQGPVIARYGVEGRQFLIVGFAVENSTWWMKESFPVFMYNAVRYMGDADLLSEQEPTRPGEPLRIPMPPDVTRAMVVRPDNSRVEVFADPTRMARFAGTSEVGIYKAEPGFPGRDTFAVNLADPAESDIRPRSFSVGGQAVEVGEKIRLQTPEIWRWFVGAALAILLLEWYVYNRRVMI
ncbi:MAG: BatA and WFA domain-containing protein [Phycisphaerales bacterium]|nr:BatA and WFA domain-containing protein [Phycisphaerales bacterium]